LPAKYEYSQKKTNPIDEGIQIMIEKTLVLIKPDGVSRSLTGEIFARFEKSGLKIVGFKMLQATRELAGNHYTEEDIGARLGEKIRNLLIDFITEGPIVAAVIEGDEAVEVVRKMCGATEPKSALPGTIRGDYSHHSYDYTNEAGTAVRNVIHAASDKEAAKYEISVWFTDDELVSYDRADQRHHWE